MNLGGCATGCTAALVLALSGALPTSLRAQFGGTLNLGTGPVAVDQTGRGDPLLHGEVAASYRMPSWLGLRPELTGEFGLSSEPGERTAMRWDFGARLHTAGEVTAWLGAAAGAAGLGRTSTGLSRLEGGVRRAFGPAGLEMWMSRTRFGAPLSQDGGLGVDSGPLDTLVSRGGGGGNNRLTEYTELGSRATVELGRYDLGFTLLRRFGSTSVRRTGWELAGTWWVAPGIGLAGATGRSLPQFGLAVPGGRYGTIGFRLSVGAEGQRASGAAERKPAARERAPLIAVNRRRLTIEWRPARTAEVMGDFTDWVPAPLEPAGDGRWVLAAELEPGVHHLNVRFDGGPWQVPSGAVAVDDGFGGRVGMVVVR